MSGGESSEQRILEALVAVGGRCCANGPSEMVRRLKLRRRFKPSGLMKAIRRLEKAEEIVIEYGSGDNWCIKVPKEDEPETTEEQSNTKE